MYEKLLSESREEIIIIIKNNREGLQLKKYSNRRRRIKLEIIQYFLKMETLFDLLRKLKPVRILKSNLNGKSYKNTAVESNQPERNELFRKIVRDADDIKSFLKVANQ